MPGPATTGVSMSMVIAFVNQKGGVGKTTLAIHTAWELARAGGNVLLMDADPQGSTSDWASLREATPFGTVSCARANLDEEVDRLRASFHWIVIDGPPRQNNIARACLVAADLVVVPVEPSVFSAYAAEDTFTQFEDALMFRPNLAICQVINRKIPNSVLGREWRTVGPAGPRGRGGCRPARPSAAGGNYHACRVRAAAGQGQVVQESAPDSPAAAEVRALGDELVNICTGLAA